MVLRIFHFVHDHSFILENGWGNPAETSCFAKLTAGVMRKRISIHSYIYLGRFAEKQRVNAYQSSTPD